MTTKSQSPKGKNLWLVKKNHFQKHIRTGEEIGKPHQNTKPPMRDQIHGTPEWMRCTSSICSFYIRPKQCGINSTEWVTLWFKKKKKWGKEVRKVVGDVRGMKWLVEMWPILSTF